MLTLTPNPDQHKSLILPMSTQTTGARRNFVSRNLDSRNLVLNRQLLSTRPAQFGNQAVLKTASVLGETAVERFSNQIYPFFRKIGKIEIGKYGGLGLEDWAARCLTLVGLYLPQGYFSIKNDSHIWETNGRNVLMWVLAVGIVSFAKNDRWGFNTVLNHFMKNRQAADANTFWGKLTSRFGLDGDYFKVLKEAGIPHKADDAKRAFWASMDSNMVDRLVHHYDQMTVKGKALSEAEQTSHKLLGQFLRRRNAFSLTATALITGLTVYLIGKVAMDIVFKYIAPLDHDYEPPLKKAQKAPVNPQIRQPEYQNRPQYPIQGYPIQGYPIQGYPIQGYPIQLPVRHGTIFAGAFNAPGQPGVQSSQAARRFEQN